MFSDKSVLVLSPEIPFPIFKGNHQRIDGVLRQLLVEGYRVRLAILNSHQKSRTSASVQSLLRRTYPGLHDVEIRRHPALAKPVLSRAAHRVLSKASNRLAGDRLASIETCPLNFRRLVGRMVREDPPDAILVNYLKLTPAVPTSYAGRRVVDTHDVQSSLLEEARRLPTKKARKLNIAQVRDDERTLLRRYDSIIAINKREAEVLAEMAPAAQILTIPAFAEVVRQPRPIDLKYDVLFVGSASPFNVDAAVNLLSWVLPEIRRRNPDVEVALAGDVCNNPSVKARSQGVCLLGRVADLSETYFQTKVVVCPLRGGAGMKIKVIEALTHGKAVVTTSVGADGIDIRSGVNGYVHDDWSAMAQRILELLHDDVLRERIERGAAELAERDHSPRSIVRKVRLAIEGQLPAEPPVEAPSVAPASNDVGSSAPHSRALVFAMDARLLMGFNVHLGEHLRRLGVDAEFLKVEDADFNFFHSRGLTVHAVKSLVTDAHRRAVDQFLEDRPELLSLDQPFIYRDVDMTDALRTHREMFPQHFEGTPHRVIRHSLVLLEALCEFTEGRRPDFLVGWNGDGPSMIFLMRVLAKVLGVPVLHVERGLFPDSYAIDPQGVNFKSGLAGSYLPLIDERDRASAQSYISLYRNRRRTVVKHDGSKASKAEVLAKLGLALEDRYVVFPEQIETDSNIILNSPWYKRMPDVIRDVVAACEPLGLRLVCRPHPEAKVRPPEVEGVVYDSSVQLHSLLEHAQATVVLNSTVGLESLMLGIPTIALANSLYSGKGITMDAACRDHVAAHLGAIVEGRYDAWTARRRLEALVALLFERYLVMMDASKSAAENLRTISLALGSMGVAHDVRGRVSVSRVAREYLARKASFEQELRDLDAGRQVVVINLLRPDTEEYWTGSDRRPVNPDRLRERLRERVEPAHLWMLPSEAPRGGNGKVTGVEQLTEALQRVERVRGQVRSGEIDPAVCIYLVDSRDAPRFARVKPGLTSREYFVDQYLELV